MFVAFALSAMLAAAPAPEVPEVDPVALAKLHQVAQCAVDDRRDRVVKLLRLDWSTINYNERLRDTARSTRKCLEEGRLRFTRLVFAGALAEGLLERALIAQPTLIAAAKPKVLAEPIKARSATEVMALCTVLADERPVLALLGTVPGSPAELGALKAIAPSLGNCLTAGAEARMNTTGARSVLALAAWRIVDERGRKTD